MREKLIFNAIHLKMFSSCWHFHSLLVMWKSSALFFTHIYSIWSRSHTHTITFPNQDQKLTWAQCLHLAYNNSLSDMVKDPLIWEQSKTKGEGNEWIVIKLTGSQLPVRGLDTLMRQWAKSPLLHWCVVLESWTHSLLITFDSLHYTVLWKRNGEKQRTCKKKKTCVCVWEW